MSEWSEDKSAVPQSSAVPLFPESQVTTDDFNVAFMSVLQRHNLTYASQTDILKLLSIVLPAHQAMYHRLLEHLQASL